MWRPIESVMKIPCLNEERDDRQHDENNNKYIRNSHCDPCDTTRTDDVRSECENDEHHHKGRELSTLKNGTDDGGIGNGYDGGGNHCSRLEDVVDHCFQTDRSIAESLLLSIHMVISTNIL